MMEAAFIQMAISITKHLVGQSTFNNQMEKEAEEKGLVEEVGEEEEEGKRAEVPAAGLTSGTSSCTCVFGGGRRET